MKRVRLLIYEGPEEWLAATRAHEIVRLGRKELGEGKSIESREIPVAVLNDPDAWLHAHGYEERFDHTWERNGCDASPLAALHEFIDELFGKIGRENG